MPGKFSGCGLQRAAHPANCVCTSVITVNYGSGITTDCEVCRTATIAEPVFGVMISVLYRVARTYSCRREISPGFSHQTEPKFRSLPSS